MKTAKSLHFVFLIISMQIIGPNLFAQKKIKIDKDLKANSQPLAAKRKGMSSVGKYEFGVYKIISGKTGLEKGSSSSEIFGDHTKIKSSKEMSFIFTGNDRDTSIANIRVVEKIETDDGNWFSRALLNWNDSDISESEGVFDAVFSFSSDTARWRLIAIYPLSIETADGTIKLDTKTKFRGMMTNGTTMIEIRQVTESEDERQSITNPVLGYQFWQDEVSMAAVQVLPGNRMSAWIRDDLDPKLKFALANGVAALFVKTF